MFGHILSHVSFLRSVIEGKRGSGREAAVFMYIYNFVLYILQLFCLPCKTVVYTILQVHILYITFVLFICTKDKKMLSVLDTTRVNVSINLNKNILHS